MGKLSPAFVAMMLRKDRQAPQPESAPAPSGVSSSGFTPLEEILGSARGEGPDLLVPGNREAQSPAIHMPVDAAQAHSVTAAGFDPSGFGSAAPAAPQTYRSPSLEEMLSDIPLTTPLMTINSTEFIRPGKRPPFQIPSLDFQYGDSSAQPALVPLQGAAANGHLSLSSNGLSELKAHEGYKANTYKDSAGYDTIGYGHKLNRNESYPNGINDTEADQLLLDDTSTAQSAVRNNVTVPLTQNQFDALTSFTYNAGVDALRRSTLLAKLNQGDYASASNELPRWNKVVIGGKKVASKGLSNRRAAEKSLFDAP